MLRPPIRRGLNRKQKQIHDMLPVRSLLLTMINQPTRLCLRQNLIRNPYLPFRALKIRPDKIIQTLNSLPPSLSVDYEEMAPP